MSAGAETPRRSASNKVRPGAHAQERLAERTHDSARTVVRDLVAPVANNAGTGRQLPIALIDSSPLNPRKHFDGDELQRLADSLAADGLLQPIVVKPAGERFLIIAGERRWRAARQLGWTDIDAIVRVDVDDATHLRLALLENLERADLDPLEEAEGYRQLQELGMTQKAIAEAVHRSQPSIANAIRLLRAPHEILDRLSPGELTSSHVLALLKYEAFPAVMRSVADLVVDARIPSKQLEAGLPDAYQLVNAGLVRELSSWRASFDLKVCEACPFGARHASAGPGERFYCLKPEHFDELEREAQQKRQAAAQRQVEKARASGKQVPKLEKLSRDSYERIPRDVPEGCSAQCACRGAGLDYGGELVEICTDPKRFGRLRSAETRKESADRKAQLKGLLDRLNDKLDLMEEIGEHELAIMAKAALQSLQTPDLREAVKWTGGVIDLDNVTDFRQRDELPRKLAALAPRDLVRMVVYAVLSHELRTALQGYGTGNYPQATWYLADQPPRPSGRALVEIFPPSALDGPPFDPDDNLASEIAADAARLESEFALAGGVQ